MLNKLQTMSKAKPMNSSKKMKRIETAQNQMTTLTNGIKQIIDNHPAIIDSSTFGRVQEELARRSGKRKVKQVGTKTELGKYSSKYALTELLTRCRIMKKWIGSSRA